MCGFKTTLSGTERGCRHESPVPYLHLAPFELVQNEALMVRSTGAVARCESAWGYSFFLPDKAIVGGALRHR